MSDEPRNDHRGMRHKTCLFDSAGRATAAQEAPKEAAAAAP